MPLNDETGLAINGESALGLYCTHRNATVAGQPDPLVAAGCCALGAVQLLELLVLFLQLAPVLRIEELHVGFIAVFCLVKTFRVICMRWCRFFFCNRVHITLDAGRRWHAQQIVDCHAGFATAALNVLNEMLLPVVVGVHWWWWSVVVGVVGVIDVVVPIVLVVMCMGSVWPVVHE